MTVQAIKPKGFLLPRAEVVRAELDRLGRLVTTATKSYPPAMPWTSTPPRTGRRAGGRRTGDLGRSVRYEVTAAGESLTLVVASDTSMLERPYNKYVIGKRQTSVMRRRAWKMISENFDAAYPETQKRLAAWARLRVK